MHAVNKHLPPWQGSAKAILEQEPSSWSVCSLSSFLAASWNGHTAHSRAQEGLVGTGATFMVTLLARVLSSCLSDGRGLLTPWHGLGCEFDTLLTEPLSQQVLCQ